MGGSAVKKNKKTTEQAILKAYYELLKEKGSAGKISVYDIAGRAGISRTTFYAHYDSVADLTERVSEGLADDLNAIVKEGHQKVPGREGYVYIYRKILEYIKSHSAESRVILLDNDNSVIADRISDCIRSYLFAYYKNRHEQIRPEVLSQTALFWTNGVYAMIKEWVQGGCRREPEEMAELMCKAIESCAEFFTKRRYA